MRCAGRCGAGDAPVLSFVRPGAPYVSIGYHRDLAEVDTDYCRAEGLPVYRRMVGGGPVYCDADQLFFQICLPAGICPRAAQPRWPPCCSPACEPCEPLGVGAELDRFGEISVGGAKVCGHGAGQIGDGATVVGNLITGFDHERATRVLRLDPEVRAVVLALMHRYVAATPVDPAAWQAAMVREYAEHFGRAARDRPAHSRGGPASWRGWTAVLVHEQFRGWHVASGPCGAHGQGARRGVGARLAWQTVTASCSESPAALWKSPTAREAPGRACAWTTRFTSWDASRKPPPW